MARSAIKIAIIAIVSALAVFAWNYVALQRNASQVIENDPRNKGIEVISHYEWLVNPNVVVFDLRNVSDQNSQLDVTRTLLQFSEKLKDHKFDHVVLAYKGNPRFLLKGDYFHTLGIEYNTQNPVYTIRTLPENVYNLDGTSAFGTWTGGVLGVLGKQMEDFGDFQKRWYLSDLAKAAN